MGPGENKSQSKTKNTILGEEKMIYVKRSELLIFLRFEIAHMVLLQR